MPSKASSKYWVRADMVGYHVGGDKREHAVYANHGDLIQLNPAHNDVDRMVALGLVKAHTRGSSKPARLSAAEAIKLASNYVGVTPAASADKSADLVDMDAAPAEAVEAEEPEVKDITSDQTKPWEAPVEDDEDEDENEIPDVLGNDFGDDL